MSESKPSEAAMKAAQIIDCFLINEIPNPVVLSSPNVVKLAKLIDTAISSSKPVQVKGMKSAEEWKNDWKNDEELCHINDFESKITSRIEAIQSDALASRDEEVARLKEKIRQLEMDISIMKHGKYGLVHLQSQINDKSTAINELCEALKKSMNRAYCLGYMSGHHDTVEGRFTDIHSSETLVIFEATIDDAIKDGTFIEAKAVLTKHQPPAQGGQGE